jgi:hypothetical protein
LGHKRSLNLIWLIIFSAPLFNHKAEKTPRYFYADGQKPFAAQYVDGTNKAHDQGV